MSARRAVVTGWSVVSPLGSTREAFADALLAGRTGARRITRFDASGFDCQVAAEGPDLDLAEALHGRPAGGLDPDNDRRAGYGAAACAGALAHAGLEAAPEAAAGRWAVSLGTGLSSVVPWELALDTLPFLDADCRYHYADFAASALDDPRTAQRHRADSVNELVAGWLGARGPSAAHFSACAAGSQAIGSALRWVRRGQADVVVCGGMDSMIHPFGLASFVLLGAVTPWKGDPAVASRPFDRGRTGFLMGEGAAALVVEELEHARARGASVYAELVGYGSSIDAHNVTAPHPEGRGAVLAMRRCLEDARLPPEQIGYINAHGTGTPLNDPVEARAIREALGAHGARVPVSSTKAAHGHLIAAAGAIEACVCLVALARGALPPTLNLDDPDPACELEHVRGEARPATPGYVLSSSFGFGGQNAVLALRRMS